MFNLMAFYTNMKIACIKQLLRPKYNINQIKARKENPSYLCYAAGNDVLY